MLQFDLIRRRDWDILVIYDACRYDVFSEVISDKARPVWSAGSCTYEWFYRTFVRPKLYMKDTIYVSGNPFISNVVIDIKTIGDRNIWDPLKELSSIKDEEVVTDKCENMRYRASKYFFKLVDAWDKAWNNEYNAPDPEKITSMALLLRRMFPNKKMIIHYFQPHSPYILCPEIYKRYRYTESRFSPDKLMWEAARSGELSAEQLRECYIKNLEYVYKKSKPILNLDAKIIITSDHGEAFGENGQFAHICCRSDKVLRTVPWYVIRTS